MATEDRAARFELMAAELREAWVPRRDVAQPWRELTKLGVESADAALNEPLARYAGARLRFAILHLLDALDRLEAEDAADRPR